MRQVTSPPGSCPFILILLLSYLQLVRALLHVVLPLFIFLFVSGLVHRYYLLCQQGDVTPLGQDMSSLPLEPRISRMLLAAASPNLHCEKGDLPTPLYALIYTH